MPHSKPLLRFESQKVTAVIRDADGVGITREIEVRTHPLSGRKCRITYSRSQEREPGTGQLPPVPPDARASSACPFCPANINRLTPRMRKELDRDGRMTHGTSTLFPNLFPYGAYSAVSLFDDRHFVEIGTADPTAYADGFCNCARYLERIKRFDAAARYTAITQNHLPSAGGSLVHPHLQVHADRLPSSRHAFLMGRADEYRQGTGRLLFSDYLAAEQSAGRRLIGITGPWHWLAAFAPEGFFEIWALYPGKTAFSQLKPEDWQGLSRGVVNAQRFYRGLCRNSYNLGMLAVQRDESPLELRVVMIVRANYAPWVRNDITGYEVMLGDMATFTAPEETARLARPYWES